MGGFSDFFFGSPEKMEQYSTLNPRQQKLQKQQINAARGRGAGGSFGDVADYYRNNLSDNPADFQAFAAPEMRRFNEDIIPGLSEQFAGMGSGGLSSSGFRNAAVGAGTDLSERLGQIRANIRQQSAQGLFNVGQSALTPTSENVMRPASEGFLTGTLMPAVGNAAMMGMGSSSPYGNMQSQANSVLSATNPLKRG